MLVNVLLVLPEQAGVSSSQELLRMLQQSIQVRVLSGGVDRQKLELALGSDQYDVVHFGQHGGRLLLEYADGALTASELVVLLRKQQHLRFVVLNSCDSIATGVDIHNSLMVPVVAMNTAIEDQAAVRFAEALYREVSAGTGLSLAVEAARAVLARLYPLQASVVQLINGSKATTDDLMAKLQLCSQEMQQIQLQIAEAFTHFNERNDELKDAINTLDSQRVRHIQSMTVALLVMLVIAQVLTPLFNSLLIH
jgi:hypothetical protein